MGAALRIGVLGFALLTAGICAAAATPISAPSHTLRPGDESSDVFLLQVLLNTSSSTQIAATGSGAPGAENNYYGTKTTAAVRRFQSIHAGDILAPQGLTAPTGIVGASTLQVLQRVAAGLSAKTPAPVAAAMPAPSPTPPAKVTPPVTPSPSPTIPTPIPLTPNMNIPQGVNPNSINLEYSLAQIDTLGKKQGIDPAKLAIIENTIRTTALSTTTNYAQKFFDSMKYSSTTASLSALGRANGEYQGTFLTRTLVALGLMHVAQAGAGVDFGGRIVGVFPCTCSPMNVGIILAPPGPPSYATVLSYTLGTELFSAHNIPLLGIEVLGDYLPAVPACLQYVGVGCAPTPTWGHITPFVGSSLLPSI